VRPLPAGDISAFGNGVGEYCPPSAKETPVDWTPYPSHAQPITAAASSRQPPSSIGASARQHAQEPVNTISANARQPIAVGPVASKQLDLETVQMLHRETGISLEDCGNLQNLLPLVPRNERGQLSSVGSISHASGQCCPCLFWFKGVCAKGLHCSYCHMWHKGQKNKRIRPSKKTRKQMRDYWESCGSAANPPQEPEAASDEDGDEGHATQCL
jgi:hypothetical protein